MERDEENSIEAAIDTAVKDIKVAYIAGRIKDRTPQLITDNITRAKELSKILWHKGFAVICPHLNTPYLEGYCPEDHLVNGYLTILVRCDLVIVIEEGLEQSEGTQLEIREAKWSGIPVYYYPTDASRIDNECHG